MEEDLQERLDCSLEMSLMHERELDDIVVVQLSNSGQVERMISKTND